jgi:ectoine hydroxylase-related dioxygenase (phytanoyl-CoA dioxygenase family)
MAITIDSPYLLPAGAAQQFATQGFIKLGDVLPAAVLYDYGAEISRLTIALNTEKRPLAERSTYDRAFLQVMNLWQSSGRVREFVLGKRVARIAAELLQVTGVRLYHDQSLYKEPGGGITPAHADQYYWPLASDRTVTAWIPLQPVPGNMGPLGFYAGSQQVEFGRELPISDESERAICAEMEARGFPFVDEPFALGDVSFHLGWTFHRAGPNTSAQPRSVMTVIYMDQDMRLAAPTNDMQRNDWQQWCPGAVPGEVIDTHLNPIVYGQGG